MDRRSFLSTLMGGIAALGGSTLIGRSTSLAKGTSASSIPTPVPARTPFKVIGHYHQPTLPIDLIHPNRGISIPDARIKLLALSILAHGLMQPILVKFTRKHVGLAHHEVVDGNYRLAAYHYLRSKFPNDERWHHINVRFHQLVKGNWTVYKPENRIVRIHRHRKSG